MQYQLVHNTKKIVSSGKYYPMGATLYPDGVNFALYSQNAMEIYLLLFDKIDGNPTDVIKVTDNVRNIWHVFVEGIKPGQLYAYKVCGDYNPNWGLRFNENKLLIDPYSKAISHKFNNPDNLSLGYSANSIYKDLLKDVRDNTEIAPKSVVISDDFDWENDVSPEIAFEKLIIYETHVKGFTASETSKVKNKGTYLGVVEKIPYLKELGVNAVELLPVQEFYVEDSLINKGLTNYWGYNTIGFFTPESSYSSGTKPGCQVNEFKTLVKEFHKAGIEVIIDVVYNHTAEGNELGPTFCFKGIDNPAYYSLTGENRDPYRYYMNYTGCGNSVNLGNAPVIKFVLDSLRYWVEVMHVDGFRFDLASVLGKEGGFFHKCSGFFDAIAQDPVLSHIKLIAEPWDLSGNEVGNFPIEWAEWNGRYRDCIRKYIKGDNGQLKELGFRLTGSSDMYADDGRTAYNSVNFIDCHDGFTLYDIVSYNIKHNTANLENNYDGTNDNNSWNCGTEGETDNQEIKSLRLKQIKNFVCCLFLSAGTPMFLSGDEFGNSQNGNNNAYCQDNKISWLNWDNHKKNKEIFDFFKHMIGFRKKYSIFQRKKYFAGKDNNYNNILDITWYNTELNFPDWYNSDARTICYLIDGTEEDTKNNDYFLFIILNSDFVLHKVKIPEIREKKWYRKIDTNLGLGEDFLHDGKELVLNPQNEYLVNPRSIVVLIGRK